MNHNYIRYQAAISLLNNSILVVYKKNTSSHEKTVFAFYIPANIRVLFF